MISYDDWWIPLQHGLSKYVNEMVIQAETVGNQPEYPFIAIKQISPAIGVGQPAIFTGDGTQTIKQDYEMVLSVTCYGSTIENAADLAMKARDYFIGKGTIELSDENIAIVEVLATNNRDVFLTVEYERRIGFDLRLRVRDTETYSIEIIEQVTLNDFEEENE